MQIRSAAVRQIAGKRRPSRRFLHRNVTQAAAGECSGVGIKSWEAGDALAAPGARNNDRNIGDEQILVVELALKKQDRPAVQDMRNRGRKLSTVIRGKLRVPNAVGIAVEATDAHVPILR